MRRFSLAFVLVVGMSVVAAIGLAQQMPTAGPYKMLKTVKVGGDGGFDYVYADSDGRRLYVPRSGPHARITVFDLDTLAPAGQIAGVDGHGVAVDPKSNHGFLTGSPIAMFDTKTLTKIKDITVQGNPDGIFFDAYNQRLYDLSHSAPNVTVIDTTNGSIVGTIDLGGAPEQAVSDGKGHLYIDVYDKGAIAVVDAKTLSVTGRYDLAGKGGVCTGLAFDVKNHILFAACRDPHTMVILNSDDGNILSTLPIGTNTDGAVFNPKTMEAICSQGDGTIAVIKENSPTSFAVEQIVQTLPGAKTLTLDMKTSHIFLITAEYGPVPATPPPGTPPGRPARAPMLPDSFSILEVGK